MSSSRSLLLVPNHSMHCEAGAVWLEAAEADLLRGVRGQFAKVGIAAFASSAKDPGLSGKLDDSAIALHRLNRLQHGTSLPQKLVNYAHAALVLPFVVRRYELVYIFCPGYCGWLTALWARLLGRRYGLYVRGSWLGAPDDGGHWWNRIFAGASFMIVTGEAFRRTLARYCARVVNEVPLTALRPADIEPPGSSQRSAQKLLFAGRLEKSKGVLDVVRAVGLLRDQGWNIELEIAGGGAGRERQVVAELCETLGVRAAVRLLGHLSAPVLADAYRSSAIFVFPSYYLEGFPRVLYEAMMFSLAIVTCELPGTRGFLTDNVNCLYSLPADPRDLARCLSRILADPGLQQRLGEQARADVERLYASFVDANHAEQLLRLAASA